MSLKTTEVLKDYPQAVGHSIPYTKEINPAILCTSMVPFDPKEATDVIMELLFGGSEVAPSKGRYLVACNGAALCSRLATEIELNNDFESMIRSRVFYVSSKEDIKSPFCKL